MLSMNRLARRAKLFSVSSSSCSFRSNTSAVSAEPYPVQLVIRDDPCSWKSIRFSVDEKGRVYIGEQLQIRLVGKSEEPCAWSWNQLKDNVLDIDGIPVVDYMEESITPVAHKNGVIGIDHIVLQSTDASRTSAAFEELGIKEVRRTKRIRQNLEYLFVRPNQV